MDEETEEGVVEEEVVDVELEDEDSDGTETLETTAVTTASGWEMDRFICPLLSTFRTGTVTCGAGW